jgi:hypothetical protein
MMTPVNAGTALARYKATAIALFRSGFREDEGFMLVRVKATVEAVGEAEELADIRRPHRIGAVIGALMEKIERAHPGVSLLEHRLTIESKPTEGKPDGTAILR